MPRAGADVDVEALVRRAKTRLNALYGIQHVRANARASDGANGDDAWAIRDADAREVARGLFADDEDGDRTSLAMVKMAFCAVERKRRLERWEYGAEWLARAERDLTKARVECGEREIPAWFLKPDCDYAIEEEGDVWMTFERAGRAVARRAVRRMRDGYALVPKRELAETYAAAVAREIREDCDRVLRKMHAWLATGTAPRAFDPKCRWNALRIVRTYQPDASELPKISAPNGSNFAKARRERRRAQRVGGVAQHAIAVEADGEADAIRDATWGGIASRAQSARLERQSRRRRETVSSVHAKQDGKFTPRCTLEVSRQVSTQPVLQGHRVHGERSSRVLAPRRVSEGANEGVPRRAHVRDSTPLRLGGRHERLHPARTATR